MIAIIIALLFVLFIVFATLYEFRPYILYTRNRLLFEKEHLGWIIDPESYPYSDKKTYKYLHNTWIYYRAIKRLKKVNEELERRGL